MKTAIITGIAGQDGAYLSHLLLDKGYKVFGTFRRKSHPSLGRLKWIGVDRDIEMIDLDLADEDSIKSSVRAIQADEIYNLAAQSVVRASWDIPAYTTQVNALGVLHLLDAIRDLSPHTRFYQASTSEMYGKVHASPQNEETPFHPRSPYGVAKVYGHFITVNYRESYGLHASSGILFNHESPLRGQEFVTRKITLGLARIAHGDPAPIALGNLDAKRDWGFAGDYVEGMWRMLQQDAGDDFVLATGVTASIRDFVEKAAASLDLEVGWDGTGAGERGIDRRTGRVVVTINPEFYRRADVDFVVGDSSKAKAKLGWSAKASVDDVAAMMARSDYDNPAPSAD